MAADQVGAFAHGVYFVPLAAVSSPELIVSALADAIGFTFHDQDPKEQLLNYLHDSKREMLLVLDQRGALAASFCFLREPRRK